MPPNVDNVKGGALLAFFLLFMIYCSAVHVLRTSTNAMICEAWSAKRLAAVQQVVLLITRACLEIHLVLPTFASSTGHLQYQNLAHATVGDVQRSIP